MKQACSRVSTIVKGTLAGFAVCCVVVSRLRADVYQYVIPTVEWLVDNSDVIAVVREPQGNTKLPPTVLRTLKGAPTTIKWPLKRVDYGSQVYLSPHDGSVRLIFVQENSRLLCAVTLGRVLPRNQGIRDRYYGTTEHGQLLLTESGLYDAIDARLKSGSSAPVALKPGEPHYYGYDAVGVPNGFPLLAEDLTYVLIVSFTTARRHHYIEKLKTGDAAERMHAILELSKLADPRAEQAIREAAKCSNVAPTFKFSWNSRAPVAITAADVRQRAERALTQDPSSDGQ